MEEKIFEEKCEKDKMLEAFISVGYKQCKSSKYFSYTFKRINKVIRLIKETKNIAEWDIEKNNIMVFDKLSASEKNIAKKFSKLPSLAEYLYSIEKNYKQSSQKIDKYTKVKEEIRQILCTMPDKEITKERLTEIINQLADTYVIDWYGDCSADHFNDNYFNYVMQTRYTIELMMLNIGDSRVSYILAKPNNKVYWDRYDDKQLLNMVKVIPLSAQREGNLFTITEKQHILFEKNCEEAYKYIKEYVMNQLLRTLAPEIIFEVCWWESELDGNKFFIHALQVKSTPKTYREIVLERLQPKHKESAKPSRLKVKIFFDENDKDGNVLPLYKKWVSQPGVIGWNTNHK